MPHDTELPTPAHGALLERALQSLQTDELVLAVLLGGSLAAGEADEESDLDLIVVVDDGAHEAFSTRLGGWLREMGAVAVAQGPVPGLLTSLMRDGLRLDVTLERRSSFAERPRRAVVVLHDPLHVVGPSPVVRPRFEPTPEWLERSVEDFLRFLDQLSVIALRKEWITGIDNAWYLISQLVVLYAHRNRSARTSPRRLNERLTAAQRAAIESLPPIRAEERAILDVHLAVAGLYLREARQFCDDLGVTWPQPLEHTVSEHLHRRAGVDPWP